MSIPSLTVGFIHLATCIESKVWIPKVWLTMEVIFTQHVIGVFSFEYFLTFNFLFTNNWHEICNLLHSNYIQCKLPHAFWLGLMGWSTTRLLTSTNRSTSKTLEQCFPNFFKSRTIKARIFPRGPQNRSADHFRPDLTNKMIL